MTRTLTSILFMILTTLVFAGSQEKLHVGTLHYNPPFEEILDTPKVLFGFDIEVMTSICDEIDEECEFIPKRFDVLIDALDKEEVQAIIVGISLMPENEEDYIFSYPYFMSEAVFITLKYNFIGTLHDKKVGVVKNTLVPQKEQLHLLYPNKNELPVTEDHIINLKFYSNLPTMLSALNSHEIVAILLDAGAANYWTSLRGSSYKQIGPVIKLEQGLRVMSTKNNQELIDEINTAIMNLSQNKKLLSIFTNYWFAIMPRHQVKGYYIIESPNKSQIVIPKRR